MITCVIWDESIHEEWSWSIAHCRAAKWSIRLGSWSGRMARTSSAATEEWVRFSSEFDFRRISIQIQPTVLTHVTYVQFCTPQYSTLIPTIVYENTTVTTVGILHLLHKWCRKGERGERLPPPNPAPPQTSESCKGWRPAHASASNENW